MHAATMDARRKRRISRMSWGLLAFVLLAVTGYLVWLGMTSWTPSRSDYDAQGPYISAEDGVINWQSLKVMGADFAYIRASEGMHGRDSLYIENAKNARAAGLSFGAVHEYSLCRLANDQASYYITTVAHDEQMLPPVVDLHFAADCKDRPARSLVLGELITFLNQIESHSGKPALLRISSDFEDHYRISEAIDRTLWLTGNYFPPDYAARPWVMWQANSGYRIRGAQGRVRWNVVKP